MQSQRVHQREITASQSLQVIQTLLRAGFGCVTYLRGLLPDENFTEGLSYYYKQRNQRIEAILAHLTSSGSPSSPQPTSQDSGTSFDRKPYPSGSVKLKTIRKGWTNEGDKLLEYLVCLLPNHPQFVESLRVFTQEEGIFDALEKQYLRSFIFAVYLDDKDPENIIEAYTFNFSYHAVPGSTSKIPIMTLGDRLDKMTLNSRSTVKLDPVAEAMVKGKAPTLGDVKQSVKNLVRTLIAAIQTLNPLPKRRFATFKVFYMDHVPEGYEPPHFSAGDSNNRYFFTTHSSKEIPEKMSIGCLVTPFHGVDMHIGSVSDVIPQIGDNDGARFDDLVNHEESSYLATQAMTLADRQKLIKVQQQDALLRKVVWDAETFANPESDRLDADGEDDPEYHGPRSRVSLSQKPTGIRCADGIEMNAINNSEAYESQVSYPGMKEIEPHNIKKTNCSNVESSATQVVEPSPCPDSPLSDIPPSPCPAASTLTVNPKERAIDPKFIQNLSKKHATEDDQLNLGNAEDIEMLDMETQMNDVQAPDTSKKSIYRRDDSKHHTVRSSSSEIRKVVQVVSPIVDDPDIVTNCDCGVHEDEDYGACQCEGPCGRWFHIWCMGYHSLEDTRLPHVFRCFGCRLRNDPQIEVLDSRNLTLEYIRKFKDLSLFRRALKIIEVHRPETVTQFKELLGSEVSTAGQTWKRLEAEGFITLHTSEADGIGFLESRNVKSHKGKGKQKAKNIKRANYSPVPEAMTGKKYQDYFDPMKEGSLLGMIKHKDISSRAFNTQAFKVPQLPLAEQSQMQSGVVQPPMQEDLQTTATVPFQMSSKRKTNGEEALESCKRMKISIGLGISLDD